MNMLPICGNEEKEGLVREGLQPYLRGTNRDETWEMEVMNLQITVRKMKVKGLCSVCGEKRVKISVD